MRRGQFNDEDIPLEIKDHVSDYVEAEELFEH
jgi:hypothetical protein